MPCAPAATAFSAIVPLFTSRLGLHCQGDAVLRLEFLPAHTPLIAPSTALAREVAQQVAAYGRDADFVFNLPLCEQGTGYQQRVWGAIRGIARGQQASYGQLAQILGSAPRAVGQACGRNPFPLITPCHRVLAKHGLGGFNQASTGWLLQLKRALLRHEGVIAP